ncbi:MAG: leucine-rich repeat protein [Verrucomicrobiota bacterium]
MRRIISVLFGCAMAVALIQPLNAAVSFSVTPSAVSNTYNGYITLQIGGLTNGESVVIQKFLDINGNGVIDPSDWLVQQFNLSDGVPGMVIGGVTNFNVPGDTDGVANGQITAAVNFYSPGGVQNIAGTYLYKLSSPVAHFTAITNSLIVTNPPYPQTISGNVVSNGTSAPAPNAVVILFQPTPPGDIGPVNAQAGVVANNAGSYTFQMPPGLYVPLALSSNSVFNYAASPMLTLAAGQTITTNLSLSNATDNISGKVVDAGNASIGLPGVLELARAGSGLFAFSFTDPNGNFNLPVTAGDWVLGGTGLGLVVHGYVGWANGSNIAAGATGVTLAYPKATALFYGSLRDNLGNPLPGQSGVVEPESFDQNNLYYTEDYTDANGNYVVAALGGLANDPWIVKLDADKRPPNYTISISEIDVEGGTNLGLGQAVLQNFTATPINSGLIQNGGFETPNFAGWTLSGDTSNTFEDDGTQSGIAFYPLAFGAALGTSSALGYLSQTVPTAPGENYLLSFWFDNPDADPGQFLVSWNGITLFKSMNPAANGWTNMQFAVSATGTSAVLEFGFENNYGNFGLDDVSVFPELSCTTNADGTLTIAGYNGLGGALTIPAAINGLTVSAIGDEAFDDASNLTSVLIPGSVTSIGTEAFENCSGLTGVTIPFSVTSLGTDVFLGCSSLGAITVASGNPAYSSSLNGVLFNKAKTTLLEFPGGLGGSYTIPGSATSIGLGAFEECTNLGSVTIPGSVTSIGAEAFEECIGLTNLTISFGVASIGLAAFEGCSNLANVTMPDSVTSLGAGAFEDCTGLTNATISSGLSSVAPGAFLGCVSLNSIQIPGSVTSLGEDAFAGCLSLSSVFFGSNAPVADGSVFLNDTVTAYYLPGTSGWAGFLVNTGVPVQDEFVYREYEGGIQITAYSGPGGAVDLPGAIDGLPVTSIAGNAFSGTALTSITIPGSVVNIGSGAFEGCASLAAITVNATNLFYTSVGGVLFDKSQTMLIQYPPALLSGSYAIPDTVAIIGIAAFQYAGLTNVTIPDSVTSIQLDAFQECTNLAGVTIPNSVTSIGEDAFQGCTALTGIIIPGSVLSIGSEAFQGCASLAAITVDATNLLYSSAGGVLFDKTQTMLIEYPPAGMGASYIVPATVITIADDAFQGCVNLTSVTIPSSVTSIGSGAFEGCAKLATVALPSTIASIPDNAFQETALTSVTVPNSVSSIGSQAFFGCAALTNVTIAASVTNIGVYAFSYCGTLSVYFEGNAPSYDYSIFTTGKGGASATVYYLPATTGWSSSYDEAPTLRLAGIAVNANPNNGVLPLAVSFTSGNFDTAGHAITNWNWNFGDGTTSTLQTPPPHTYTSPGTFAAWLIETNNHGVGAAGGAATIGVSVLTVAFTADYETGGDMVPIAVDFSAASVDSAGNRISRWNWNFGDGTTSTNQYASHIYTVAGTFPVALLATNNLGSTVYGAGPASITAQAGPVYSGLVLNGGFETGDFTGWNQSGDTSYTFVDNGSQSDIPPFSGNFDAVLGTSGSIGLLSQTLSTTPGANYLLSFWLANPFADPAEFIVSWNGNTVFNGINPLTRGWTNLQFALAATETNTVLQFVFEDDSDYLGLDDISVVPAQLGPRIATLGLSGANLALNGINGQSGGTYYVLTSTNVALPLSQWTPVATNVLGAGANFIITVTNGFTPGTPQRFYVLQLQ